jgi:hypothetical protein
MKSSPALAQSDPTGVELHTVAVERERDREHAMLRALVVELLDRVAALESRVPPPHFEVPKHWISIKRASGLCGNAPPTLYRWVRIGRIVGAPYGGRVYVDPTSLPKRSEII